VGEFDSEPRRRDERERGDDESDDICDVCGGRDECESDGGVDDES
jgi:hypothetical protein